MWRCSDASQARAFIWFACTKEARKGFADLQDRTEPQTQLQQQASKGVKSAVNKESIVSLTAGPESPEPCQAAAAGAHKGSVS